MTIVPTQAAREAAASLGSIFGRYVAVENAQIRLGQLDGDPLVQGLARIEQSTRQAFLTEILDHLTTEHSGGLGSHPGARVLAEAIERKFGASLTSANAQGTGGIAEARGSER